MGLLDFLGQIPDKNSIKGSFGEWISKWFLKWKTDGLVLHDVLIDGADDGTSQIDLIMIDNKGIFVFEVKMYTDAVIYGDGNRHKWYYYLGGKKYDIYSPLKQNEKHIEYLKKFLPEYFEAKYFSVIVMLCKDMKLSNINKEGEELKNVVCSGLPILKQAIEVISKESPVIFDDDKKKEIYDYILNNQYNGKEARKEHIERVKGYVNEKKMQEELNICPICKAKLVLRKGKFGKFYGCSNYPECKYTKEV